jgi:hypothetical protein
MIKKSNNLFKQKFLMHLIKTYQKCIISVKQCSYRSVNSKNLIIDISEVFMFICINLYANYKTKNNEKLKQFV